MPFVPANLIKTGSTSGGEYVTPEGKSYVGPYYSIGGNSFFKGKGPTKNPTESDVLTPTNNIFPTTNNPLDFEVNINLNLNTITPQYFSTKPTEEDYQVGEFTRYFCKKRNQNIYLEISESDYNSLDKKIPPINFIMWKPFTLVWELTGNETQVKQTNRNITLLTEKQNKLPGLSIFLKEEYLKYYRSTPSISSKTPKLTPTSFNPSSQTPFSPKSSPYL